MPSAVTSPEEDVTLHCPSCGEEKFLFVPMSGKNGERFVRIHCHKCQEHLFFQNPELPNSFNNSNPGLIIWGGSAKEGDPKMTLLDIPERSKTICSPLYFGYRSSQKGDHFGAFLESIF